MPPPNPRKPGNARPSLPSLVLARLTNADQRRSTPQPGNCQPTSPHTPLNPQTPPSVAKRLCTLSPLDSPLISPTDEDEDKYEWTHDQLATVIRTLEDGYVGRPSRFPQTPYNLRFVPENLVANWARALKRTTDWPHSVRSICKKLKDMSVIITNPAQDDPYLDDEDAAEALMNEEARERPISPRKQISERDKDKLWRSAARCHQACDSVLSPKFHPYQRPGALSPTLSASCSSTHSFKHTGRGLSPSPILSNEGPSNDFVRKPGKLSTPFRSVTPSPTSSGLEAGYDYDDPPVLSVALEPPPSKFARPEFTQFRSPVPPGSDMPETPAGRPRSVHVETIAPSPLPTPAPSTHIKSLSAFLSESPFSSAPFGATLVGRVNASIENLNLATPRPSRGIQRSQSFTARPGDGVKRAPTYGREVPDNPDNPDNVDNARATLQQTEHTEATADPDLMIKSRGATRRKHQTATPAPSAWDTRKKADKRPRSTSSSDTEGWRSLVPLTSSSKMDTSPTTPKAGISRGGVRVKRARKEDDITPIRTTAHTGNNAVASRLTRSSKKLHDALGLSSPSRSSSRGPASPGSPMLISPLQTKAPPIGPATKRQSTSHRRATSLLASDPSTITKEQLQDENQDTSMIVIEQPERRSSSPALTRNVRRVVGTAQFPPKVKRTKNQGGGDPL